MKYLNRIVLLCLLSAVWMACGGDDDEEPFDPVQQAIIDEELIVDYLQSHFYNAEKNSLDTIYDNQTSLWDDDRLGIDNITENDIDYKLYYLTLEEGVDKTPSTVDSVFTRYNGTLMATGTSFDSNDNIWFTLDAVIKGWAYGFTHFKSGINTSQPDEPLSFEGTGKGFLFMPSGLAYQNSFLNGIPENSNLIFEIELKQVVHRDHDLDGTLSKDEDVNGNRDLTDDDTDGDGVPDYLDSDNF